MSIDTAINFVESLITKVEKSKSRLVSMRYVNKDILAKFLKVNGSPRKLSELLGFAVSSLRLEDCSGSSNEMKIVQLFTIYYGNEMTSKQWAVNAKTVIQQVKESL